MAKEKTAVTPSGVQFSVRSLKGKDQEMLSKVNQDGSADSSQFNKMLADALLSLGDKAGSEITEKTVRQMLANDRKFVLVVLRMYSLDYQEEFVFNFEWPMSAGDRNKLTQEYSVNFTHENFPVTPYAWMREHIDECMMLDSDDSNFIDVYPDGHENIFPVIFDSYKEMIDTHKEIEGKFPRQETDYKWELLDGEAEKAFGNLRQKDLHANVPIEMHRPQELFKDGQTYKKLNLRDLELADIEHLRKEIKDIEGSVDTTLTIQHPENENREKRIDLIATPAFFFPSQAL